MSVTTQTSKMFSQAFQGLKRRLSTGSSPQHSPTSSSSLHEMMNSSDSVTSQDSPVVPSAAYRQRRRASMQDALDYTKINTSLYERMTLQQMQQASLQEENLGSVNFSLMYNSEQGLLTVRLIQAQELVSRTQNGTANPYCILSLLPNRRRKIQSRLHKNTLNPEFEEEFMFDVMAADIDKRTLELLIYDHDAFSRHHECIGQVQLPLEQVDLSDHVLLWKGISQYEQQEEQSEVEIGDLMFSLSYLPSAERLTVTVIKCRNLQAPEDAKSSPNVLVKVMVNGGSKKPKKKKTSTQRNTVNPIWNEALLFSIGRHQLSNSTLELIVLNDNLLGHSEALGRVILGPESTGEELTAWRDMINAKSANARWHHLSPP